MQIDEVIEVKKNVTIYSQRGTAELPVLKDFYLLMYKWSAQKTILQCWDGKNLTIDENHPFFWGIDKDTFCEVLVCTLYQYHNVDALSLSNRIWGYKLAEMGAPKDPKYAIDAPLKAIDKFTTFVRKLYNW